MRVERYFTFMDLSGFTLFTAEHGDDESIAVLTAFRAAARRVATDFGVRIAKWLGDGCMLVSVDGPQLIAAVLELERLVDDLELPLQVHAGVAGGAVILLEGDDYTGSPVNLASRLCDVAGPHEILATPEMAALAPETARVEAFGTLRFPGFSEPVDVMRLHRAEEPAGSAA